MHLGEEWALGAPGFLSSDSGDTRSRIFPKIRYEEGLKSTQLPAIFRFPRTNGA
jgi:hypothetical protein